MKALKDYKRNIIAVFLVVVILFSGRWIYRQWVFFQKLIEEKGESMGNRYSLQKSYLEDLENITTKIILTKEPLEKVKEDIKWLNELYWGIMWQEGYSRHGYLKDKIEAGKLEDFIRISNRFLKSYSRERIELTDDNVEVLKKINMKARELNSINDRYYYIIREIEGVDLFYSDVLVKAVNEMNSLFDEYPRKELDYDLKTNKENEINRPKPEEVYGSKILSEEEAKKIAKDFLGEEEFGEIIRSSYENDDEDIEFHVFEFRTKNGYEIEIHALGGKIAEIKNQKHNVDKDIKEYKKPKINISKEDAVNKLSRFLSSRGFNSLIMIESKELGEKLEIRFAQIEEGYINMAAEVIGKVDMTQEGKLLELDFSEYWKGLVYDDSEYDVALKGYKKAKAELKQDMEIKEERLVGRKGRGFKLNFYWRFTTEFDGEDYYIYVDPFMVNEVDISKVYK